MKKFFRVILNILETLGRAKAAAHLARIGKYKEANTSMSNK